MKILSALIALGSFIQIANCCWQAEVVSFSNRNKVTDFLTEEDEITLRFGVGQVIAY